MSRSSSLRRTLQLPADQSLEVLSTQPSGDCFYDCIHELLSKTHDIKDTPLFVHLHDSPQLMREHVAERLSLDQFEMYQMYAAAGVEEYAFMSLKDAPQNLRELRDFAKRSGKQYGPGQCLWADEFALRTISDRLHLTLLIVDDQAQGARASGKRRRCDRDGASKQVDGRFVSIGNYTRGVILHRSRREHFNAVIIDRCGVFDIGQSPVASLWPTIDAHMDSNDSNKSETKQADIASVEHNVVASTSNNDTNERKEESKQQPIGKFYVGCAGFSNSTWVGSFYPKSIVGHNTDRQFSHYQEHFSAVELNSTFYGVPSDDTVLRWRKICAKSFRLVAKAPKGVTHENDKLNSSALIFFLNRMEPLKDVLVCILIQCPRTLAVDVSQLEEIKTKLQKEASWYTAHLAFEFRNETAFLNASVRDFLAANKWTFVVHPDSLERSTIGSSVSGRGASELVEYEPQKLSQFASTCSLPCDSEIIYIRLHGTNDEHRGEYTSEQLKEISEQVHTWRLQGKDVYCFFLNDLEPIPVSPLKGGLKQYTKWSATPKNAKQLEEMVFELGREPIPNAPKKPKATLLTFFAKK